MINKISKVIVVFVIFSLAGSPMISQEKKVPRNFPSFQAMQEYFNYNIYVLPDESSPEINSYGKMITVPEASAWNDMTIDGKKYRARLIRTQLLTTNANGIEDVEQICSLAPGGKFWTTETIMTCATTKVNANIGFSISLSKDIGISLGLQQEITKQRCYTIAIGKEYTFPPNCNGFNSSIIYTGIRFDLHQVTMEIAPYEIANRIALLDCLKQCMKIRDGQQAAICENNCYNQYGLMPNYNKITTYYFTVLKPEPTTWSVCLNI